MKFATLRTGEVVAQTDDGYRRVNRSSMIDVIENYPSDLTFSGEPMELPETLAPPIPRPSKIWAAAGNYQRVDAQNPNDGSGRGQGTGQSKEELLHSLFLKPPSALIGAGDNVVIPPGAGSVFPEVELCVVIGKQCRHISVEDAPSVIFGYSLLNDVTARNYTPQQGSAPSMRCIRKGYDTFAPFGPVIATSDEIPDPHALVMNMWVNEDLHQSSSTETMINNVFELVSFLSQVCTLEPGDLISTGTPDSPAYQRQLVPGDTILAEIVGIGKMKLGISAG